MRRTADPATRLASGLAALSLDAAFAAPLTAYLAELSKWNRAYNLTAVRDVAEMVTRHVLDSLAILPAIAPHLPGASTFRMLDVGSGAGLPGIPLAIVRPAWQLTLLDSNGKKTRFLRHAVRTLHLANVEVIEARAETVTTPFDVIVSRAYASLADFVESTHAALAPGGTWLAMKGKLEAGERDALPPTVRVIATPSVTVPGLDEDRHVVVMRQ